MPMQLGTLTISNYPSDITIPRSMRSNAYLETMESVAHFTWGFFLAGKIIELSWNFMPSEQFDDLDTIFQGDSQVVWDPGFPVSGSDAPATYNVQILDFTGEFHEAVGTDTEVWRKNCRMILLVMSEV